MAIVKTTKIRMLDGPFTDEWFVQPVNGGVAYVEPVKGFVWADAWEFVQVESLQFLNENITGGGMSYSPGWGLIGAEALGPAGLALGAKKGKVTQIIYFVCKLTDGRQFTAATDPQTWELWRKMMAKPFHQPTQQEVPPPPKNFKDIGLAAKSYVRNLYAPPMKTEKALMGCVVIPIASLFLICAANTFFHWLLQVL